MTPITQWEYRVKTFGAVLRGARDEDLETILNEWGAEGWELVNAHRIENTSKVTILAKRPLTDRVRRQRSFPV